MYVHMHVLIINKPSFYPSIPCRSISIWYSPYIAQGRLDSSTFECLGLNTIETWLCKHTYVQNYKDNTKIMLWNIWEKFNKTMLCITKLVSFFFFETKSRWTQSGLRFRGWPTQRWDYQCTCCTQFCVELRSKPMAVGTLGKDSTDRLISLAFSTHLRTRVFTQTTAIVVLKTRVLMQTHPAI